MRVRGIRMKRIGRGNSSYGRANCRRSIRGKKGQAALRELEAALQALPHPQQLGT